jgi:hypothetical protein
VVVHAHDALVADAAVVHTRFLHQVAFEAIRDAVQCVDLFSKWQGGYRLTSPRLRLAARHSFFVSFCLRVRYLIYSSSSW